MRKTLLFLFILSFSTSAIAQKERMNTFFVGYIGGWSGNEYENHSLVTVVDTGLVFSERLYCQYSLFDPSYTYNNAEGVPQFHWQGCYILDANTLSPIENGDYTQSLGGGTCELNKNFFPEMLSHQYNYENLDFVLTRSEEEVYLIFSRYDILAQLPIEIYYSVVRYNTATQSWYVHSKYNRIDEGFEPLYGSIQPVRHANGLDWWIIVGEKNSKTWRTYLFNENGVKLEKTSTLNEIGDYRGGYANISPDGRTFIYHEGKSSFFVADFDRCNGELKFREMDEINSVEEDGSVRWVEFSPNGRFAYLSTLFRIFQYDLHDINFKESKTLVATFDFSLQEGKWPVAGGFERPFRATNGRIYHWAGNTLPLYSKIEYPDRKGPDVGFVQDYIQTPIALPWRVQKFVDYTMEALPEPCPIIKNNDLEEFQISVFPNPVTSTIYLSGYPVERTRKANIIDGRGTQVWSGNTDLLNRGVNVSGWTQGVYFLKIDGMEIKKFAKI